MERELVPDDVTEQGAGVGSETVQQPHRGGVAEDEPPAIVEDEHRVAHAVHRLLQPLARVLGLGGELAELLVGLLQLLRHHLALLELVLELHRLILELVGGEGELARGVEGFGAGATEAVEGGAEEAADEEEYGGGDQLLHRRGCECADRPCRRIVRQHDADAGTDERGQEAAAPRRVRTRHPEQEQASGDEMLVQRV